MLSSRACVVFALSLFACSSYADDGLTGETSLALSDGDPVSKAVSDSCTTSSVKGLSTQLVEEIQCLRPGTLKNIEGESGLTLGSAVFPWMQTKAAEAVVAAQKERGVPLEINSALRTLPQQFLLYSWYQSKRCNIGLAAHPGQSNHESGLAVDVEDNVGWRDTMSKHDMKWLGSSDPVHFDYVGEGRVDLGGLSVLAFQKLWNANHPEDPIAEDSAYGDETEKRLAKSPVGGFPKGPDCSAPPAATSPPPPPSGGTTPDTNATQGDRGASDDDGGCAVGVGRRGSAPAFAGAAILFALGLLGRVRRRGSAGSALREADSRRTR